MEATTREDPAARGDADVATIAVLLGDASRVRMLMVLADGQAHSASALASAVGLKPSAATAHLQRLVAGGLVHVEQIGRFRAHSLASHDVARLVEALAAVAPPARVTSLRSSDRALALRAGRTCYDHLAGRLGVAVADALRAHDAVLFDDPAEGHAAGSSTVAVELGPAATPVFEALGIPTDQTSTRRPAIRLCLDWSERRFHLAGALGATMLDSWLQRSWVARHSGRSVRLTPTGRKHLVEALPGIALP